MSREEWAAVSDVPPGPVLEFGTRFASVEGWIWCGKGLWVVGSVGWVLQKPRDWFLSRAVWPGLARALTVGPSLVLLCCGGRAGMGSIRESP